MKVKLKHIGCSPANNYHVYAILTETGIADIIYEREYTNAKEVDMPDEIWAEGSGWADIECDSCHTTYRERTAPGLVVACPVCSEPYLIPEGAILDPSNDVD